MKRIKPDISMVCAFIFAMLHLSQPLYPQNTNASTNLAGQVGAGTPCPGTTQHLFYQFHLRATSFGAQTFTALTNFTTSGTYLASDVVRYQFWSTNFSFFGGGSLVLHATLPASGPGAKTFSGFSRSLPGGGSTPVYFWITVDIAAGAVPGRTLQCDLLTAPMFTVSGGGVTTGPTWAAAGTQTICTPLPIELVYFRGKSSGMHHLLQWETASESNNDHFTLERSCDGIIFEPFAEIKGAGNSRDPLYYEAMDPLPAKEGMSYYRLKQTDQNGEFSYEGGVIALYKTDHWEPVLLIDPGGQYMSVRNIGPNTAYAIFDISGKTLQKGTLSENERINVSAFKRGTYLIRFSDGKNSCTQKLIL